MKRLLPFPGLSLFLLSVWMLLANQWGAGTWFLGALLAWLLPLATRVFWPRLPGLARFDRLVVFLLVLQWDIVSANVAVARRILGRRARLRPAFVEVPLAIDNDFVLTMLASTVSLTPGTVAADISEDRKRLLVHALDVDDEQALIRTIRERYEQPLREIFRC